MRLRSFQSTKNRFINNGFVKQKIKNKTAYFKNLDNTFKYPDSAEDIWEQRAYSYAYTYPEIVRQIEILDDDIKAQFTEGDHDAFYNYQVEYCELFSNNELYE